MSTHSAVVMVAVRAPLDVIQVPTVQPEKGEVLVRVEWVASTPLDLHQADGGLLVKHPQIPGDGMAGDVIQVGPDVQKLKVGDKVFGFGFRSQKEKGAQEYATYHENLLGKIPQGFSYQEAVTLPNNFVTVFHALTKDLQLSLPWPRSETAPENAGVPILIWGASSSVGLYAVQILKYYGFTNLIGTASKAHHAEIKAFGARHIFDYRETNVVGNILEAVSGSQSPEAPVVPLILDCIGSQHGSLQPISQLAQKGAQIAVLLPVIVKDASETEAPKYSLDPTTEADWAEGAIVRGVRTHFYLEDEFFRQHLQPEIMPAMLEQGIVKANRFRIVEGQTLKKRAQEALDILRKKEVSGERLVWRIRDC